MSLKIGNSAIPPILLLVGPERWLRNKEIVRLKERCIAPGFEELDLVTFEEPLSHPRVVLEALETLPFGSGYRLVIVSGLRDVKQETLSWLTGYLAHPSKKSCLVLCAENLEKGTSPATLSRRYRGLHHLWCLPLKGKELKSWLLRRAAEEGLSIESDAADLLLLRVGSELESLNLALEGLVLLAGDSGITQAHVEALIFPSARETAFDILDRAAGGSPEEAIGLLRQGLVQGKLTLEHHFLGALGWYYRYAWRVRENPSAGGWATPSRIHAMRRLSRWPTGKLQTALEEVLEAEVQVKTGHPSPELLADQLLLKLGAHFKAP